jgi:CheY-like chemotaxis protein
MTNSVRKPTILAVDDVPANLIALEAVLEREFELVTAPSGARAIEILRQRSDIAVILMDVQMPVMDGYEAAAHIKKLPECADIPIVFITAVYHEDPYVKRGYQAGGIDYFTKPFDPELLRLKMTIYSSFRHRAAVLQEREAQIRETEELLKVGRRLSAVLDSLPVGVLIADNEGRICQTNDEVARICKATQAIAHDAYGEVLGWWTEGGRHLKDPHGPLSRALRAGEASHCEKLRIRCFDGTTKSIVASASPLFAGGGGSIVGAVVVIKDISESKMMEQELETRVARLVSLGIELEHLSPRP